MKFQITLLLIVYARNSSSVSECYVCSDAQCQNLTSEECPEGRNLTCMATLTHELGSKKVLRRGCSEEERCAGDEETAKTTDCYVCNGDLCNKDVPGATFCYTCVHSGCTMPDNITTQRCGTATASTNAFHCYSAIMHRPVDPFGTLTALSAGCISKESPYHRCYEKDNKECNICSYSFCNTAFHQAIHPVLTTRSTRKSHTRFTTPLPATSISFGLPEESGVCPKTGETSVAITVVFLIMISVPSIL